jgi:hypothetical protein
MPSGANYYQSQLFKLNIGVVATASTRTTTSSTSTRTINLDDERRNMFENEQMSANAQSEPVPLSNEGRQSLVNMNDDCIDNPSKGLQVDPCLPESVSVSSSDQSRSFLSNAHDCIDNPSNVGSSDHSSSTRH